MDRDCICLRGEHPFGLTGVPLHFRNHFQTIRDLIESGRTKIILNFLQVSSMDSSGVGELAGAYAPVKSRGGDLKFLNPSKKVHGVLQITQLDRVFEVYTDEQTAIRSFS
jgi:anti-sigma B factor antagonist